jgi:hypothetical protein
VFSCSHEEGGVLHFRGSTSAAPRQAFLGPAALSGDEEKPAKLPV